MLHVLLERARQRRARRGLQAMMDQAALSKYRVNIADRRFTVASECPVCGGWKDGPTGKHCFGFLTEDGSAAFCTEVESGRRVEEADAWLHSLDGDCSCDVTHADAEITRPQASTSNGNVHRLRSQANASHEDALDWFVDYTGVEREVWERLGVEERGRRVVFTFAGHEERKVRESGTHNFTWEPEEANPVKRLPLWPVPGDTLPAKILITAGESDCGSAHAAGMHAFAITSGEQRGKAVLTRAHYRSLARRGVERVLICGDADETGQEWSANEAQAAALSGLEVEVLDLTPLYDPFGGGIKDLNDLWKVSRTPEAFRAVVEEHSYLIPSGAEEVDLDDFLVRAEEPIPWLIDELLARGEIALIAAPQKTYKTWFMLAMVRALATGGVFLQPGWAATGKHRVLIVEEEGNEVKFAQRLRTANFEGGVGIRFRKGSDLTSADYVDALIERVRRGSYDVLVLDPLQRMSPNVNENDAGDMGRVWDNLHKIARTCPNLAIIILHHFNKAAVLGWQGIRGSSRTGGEVDVAFFLEKADGNTLKLALDGRDIPNYLDAGEALNLEVEISTEDRVLRMETRGKMQIKIKIVSKVRTAVEEFLKAHPGVFSSTTEVFEAVNATTTDVVGREAVLKQLRVLQEDQRVVGETHGTRGGKAWKWVEA